MRTLSGARAHAPLVGFAVLVVANLAWLIADVRSRREDGPIMATVYAQCRAAIRRAWPEAARARFPTGDLIRVSRRGPRWQLRGFFEVPDAARPRWYSCTVSADPSDRLTVDSVEVDPLERR